MQEKFNQFLAQTNGKFIEAEDSANYAQCMDLAFKWLDFLGIPRDTIRHLYAYQVWTMPFDSTRQYFDMIANGPTNAPVVGDIPVFGQAVGYAGHISIATEKSTGKDLISLDQNWGTPKNSRIVTHANYYGVLGWLHPKNQSGINYDDKLNKIKNIINAGGTSQDKIKNIDVIIHAQ